MDEKFLYKNIVSGSIAPLLKEAGFARRGVTWNRGGEAGIFVLNLQNSKPRIGGGIDVTINIGILIEDVWRLCWGRPVPDFVKEENCYPRFRIGDLLSNFAPRPLDKWWKIAAVDGPETTEMVNAVRQDCLVYFDEIKSREVLTNFVQQKYKDRMPLEHLQRALLLGLEGYDVSQIFSRLQHDDYWRQFAESARRRLESHLKNKSDQ